jgi:hypothetical protein
MRNCKGKGLKENGMEPRLELKSERENTGRKGREKGEIAKKMVKRELQGAKIRNENGKREHGKKGETKRKGVKREGKGAEIRVESKGKGNHGKGADIRIEEGKREQGKKRERKRGK